MWTFQGNYPEIMPTNCWRLWVYNCSCSFKVPSRPDQGNHCQSSQGWWCTVTEFLSEERQANQFSLRAVILTNCLVSLCFHSRSWSAWQGRAVTLPISENGKIEFHCKRLFHAAGESSSLQHIPTFPYLHTSGHPSCLRKWTTNLQRDNIIMSKIK